MGFPVYKGLTLNAPIATKVVCFSRLLKSLRSLSGKQCGPRSDCSYIGAVCSGTTLFASIHNSSVMLANYLQQTTSADDISLGALRVKEKNFISFCFRSNPYVCMIENYIVLCKLI